MLHLTVNITNKNTYKLFYILQFRERIDAHVAVSASITAPMWVTEVTVLTSDEISPTRLESWQAGTLNSNRLFFVVEEFSVARLLSRARGLWLGTGSDILKESTKTIFRRALLIKYAILNNHLVQG